MLLHCIMFGFECGKWEELLQNSYLWTHTTAFIQEPYLWTHIELTSLRCSISGHTQNWLHSGAISLDTHRTDFTQVLCLWTHTELTSLRGSVSGHTQNWLHSGALSLDTHRTDFTQVLYLWIHTDLTSLRGSISGLTTIFIQEPHLRIFIRVLTEKPYLWSQNCLHEHSAQCPLKVYIRYSVSEQWQL
jgi:hypothetical protein